MEEEWKYIEGYEGLYKISSFGNVFSCRIGRLLKIHLCPKGNGYFQANLSKKGKVKTLSVSRLVAKHFVENPENKPEVNHKDLNSRNNRMENLEWTTHAENVAHAMENYPFGTFYVPGELHRDAKHTTEQVLKVRALKESGMKLRDISDLMKIPFDTVCCMVYRKSWKHI